VALVAERRKPQGNPRTFEEASMAAMLQKRNQSSFEDDCRAAQRSAARQNPHRRM